MWFEVVVVVAYSILRWKMVTFITCRTGVDVRFSKPCTWKEMVVEGRISFFFRCINYDECLHSIKKAFFVKKTEKFYLLEEKKMKLLAKLYFLFPTCNCWTWEYPYMMSHQLCRRGRKKKSKETEFSLKKKRTSFLYFCGATTTFLS